MRILASLLVALFIVNVVGFAPANADPDGPQIIGRYDSAVISGDLTEDHLVSQGEGYVLQAPTLADRIAVDLNYLDATIPGWAADERFSVEGGRAVFPGKDVTISPFEPSDQAVFTMGSPESVLFTQRPMWVWVEETSSGIKLHMNDGDPSAQDVVVAQEWLWTHWIHTPRAVHESGENVTVRMTEDKQAFVLEMPHFSWVLLEADADPDTDTGIDIRGKLGDTWVPHEGLIWWNSEIKRLEVNVLAKPDVYQVWIEKEWVDKSIPYMGLREHIWTHGVYDGKAYRVVTLDAEQTPTTLVLERFFPTGEPTYTKGNPDNIALKYLDIVALTNTTGPSGEVQVNFTTTRTSNVAAFNETFLASRAITNPAFLASDGEQQPFYRGGNSFEVPTNDTVTIIRNESVVDYELQLLNITDMESRLATGTFEIEILGSTHSYNVTSEAKELYWEDTQNGTNGTIDWTRYIFFNDTAEHVIGYGTVTPIGLRVWIQGNETTGRPNLTFAPTGRHFDFPVGGLEEVMIQASPPPTYFTTMLAADLGFGIMYDYSAAEVVMKRYGNSDPYSLCRSYTHLYPITTFAYEHAGVYLSPESCFYEGGGGIAPDDKDICDFAYGVRDNVRDGWDIEGWGRIVVGLTASEKEQGSRGCQIDQLGPIQPYPLTPDDYPSRYSAISIRETRYALDDARPSFAFEHAVAIVWQHEVGHSLSLYHQDVEVSCEYPGTMYPAEGYTPMAAYDPNKAFTEQYCPQFEYPPNESQATINWESYEAPRVQMSSFIYSEDDEHWW